MFRRRHRPGQARPLRPRHFILALSATAVLATAAAAPASNHEGRIEDLRSEQEGKRKEREELAREAAEVAEGIDALAVDDENLVEALSALDRFVAYQESQIAGTELLIVQHEAEAAAARIEAERLAAEIEAVREQLRRRAIDAFVQPPAHVVDPLASEDFTETARRQYLLNQVIGDELEIVDRLRSAESALEEARRDAFQQAAAATAERESLSQGLADLEQSRATAERLREEVQIRIAGLEQASVEIDTADTAMVREIQNIDVRIEQIEEAERRLQAELERQRLAELERQRRAAEEARRKAEEEERRRRAGQGSSGEFILVAWPAAGDVVSGFGPRTHPIFGVRRNHNGIDIDGDTGDPVRAALVGEVIIAGWRNGFGNTVVLNHYDGYTTLYAHLSKILVSKGTEVDHGDLIGEVGSTGWSTGPHLHFEVRLNGKALNPRPFLP